VAAKRSAGLLVFRRTQDDDVEVLLVHPGGPFWARRDAGAWSIPKGEYEEDEDAFVAATREFEEELGSEPPRGDALDLGASSVRSNEFEMEWPPRSGRRARFPEVDRADWFGLEHARTRLVAAQAELIDRLVERLRTA
jgi:predicted NUDIX family NTP pyrophosphohydrolase